MRNVTDLLSLATGTLLAAWGLAGFLLPNHFIDGGVTGISMLLAELAGWPLAWLLVLVNVPFLVLGYQYVGRSFTTKSTLAICALAAWLSLVPFPVVTKDPLLAAVFGGCFIGAGIGLAIRGGGVLDGTEILAVILSKRTFATVGEIILGLNVIIFLVAARFLGIEPALYSVLTYFAAFRTIDYLLHGIESYNSVMIMSTEHAAIQRAILSELGRGVTAFKSIGGFTTTEREVLYCVVTRLELIRLETLVKSRDSQAFLVISPVHEVRGGVVKQRAFH